MRARALEAARLEPGLKVLDAGAGTGFTTEGIVARANAADVTMLDQSPHQLKRSRAKPALADCPRVLGDAEALPFADDSFDRYVSAGSIEYWPDPQQGIAEAYRVTRAGGTALMIGPVRPANRAARALAEAWMLFPPVEDYTGWMEAAGFTDVTRRRARAGLVPRPARALRAGRERREAGARPVARRARGPGGRGAARGAAEVRRALRGRLGGRRRLRPDRRRARPARAATGTRRRRTRVSGGAARLRPGAAPAASAAASPRARANPLAWCCGGSRGRTR